MAIDLEKQLAELSENEPPLELDRRLQRVKASARAIWEHPRLPWFTDHTAQRHSPRIIQLLGQALDDLQEAPQALTRSELYVLLAAAYLHDIGMQDFRHDGKAPEAFGIEDYEFIRRRHPRRGRELVVQRSLNAGLNAAPENVPLRGEALAALLLMADELDIHEDRATFPKELDLSPLASMHHHLNHYVTRVELVRGTTRSQRSIRLFLTLPADAEAYGRNVIRSIGEKLARQATLTNGVLERTLDGGISWSLPIIMRVARDDSGARRALPQAAQQQLAYELAESDVIDRDEIIGRLRTAIGELGKRRAVIELVDSERSDLGTLLRWLKHRATLNGVPYAIVSFSLAIGHGPAETLVRLRQQLGGGAGDFEEYDAATERRAGVTEQSQAFGADLKALADGRAVIVFDALDSADPSVFRSVKRFIANLDEQSVFPLIIVVRSATGRRDVGSVDARFELRSFTTPEITTYLETNLGEPRHSAELLATEFVALSEGVPALVHAGMHARRLTLVEDDFDN
jgi:hypothetical protein